MIAIHLKLRVGCGALLCLVLAGCGASGGGGGDLATQSGKDGGAGSGKDAGGSAADLSSTGAVDGAGSDAAQSERRDLGTPIDAAVSTDDAGTTAAPLAPAIACADTADAIYTTPAGLLPMTDTNRGDIVACTGDGPVDLATVGQQLTAAGVVGVTATTGVDLYRIEFRTYRGSGADGLSSARVYLPHTAVASQPPIIVIAHPTEGLADNCVTSKDMTSLRNFALPWAALGYPVIAPDYAGLGNDGVQGYMDNHDTAQSVLDAVSALRKLLPAGALGRKVAILGHSQGGGATLSAQALARSYGLDGDLVATAVFAPEYFSHINALGYIGALRSVDTSDPLTIFTGVTKCTVATMMEYAYFANHVPNAMPTDGFPAAKASGLGSAINGQCTVALGGLVQADAPYVHDWIDATLRKALLNCIDTQGAGALCTGPGQAYWQYLAQDILPPDSAGAPILYTQGLKDIIMPPAEEAACNLVQLTNGGVTPQVCTDAQASHTDVVQRNIGFAIGWVQSIFAGTPPATCSAAGLPSCSAP